jgi:hypothetical protein
LEIAPKFRKVETAEHHLGQCLFNFDDNRACYTCKHAIEVKVAPYPGNETDYTDWGTIKYLGKFDYIKCGKTDEKQTQEQLLSTTRDCWEKFEEQQMDRYETDEYVEHLKLIEQVMEDENAFGEYFQEEGYKEVSK